VLAVTTTGAAAAMLALHDAVVTAGRRARWNAQTGWKRDSARITTRTSSPQPCFGRLLS
jgi:hypothetical protein